MQLAEQFDQVLQGTAGALIAALRTAYAVVEKLGDDRPAMPLGKWPSRATEHHLN